MYRLGVHTFYRPRAWGDGSDVPVWGVAPPAPMPAGAAASTPDAAKEPSAAAKNPEAAAKAPQAAVTPEPAAAAISMPVAKL
jgi:hypothetical protein